MRPERSATMTVGFARAGLLTETGWWKWPTGTSATARAISACSSAPRSRDARGHGAGAGAVAEVERELERARRPAPGVAGGAVLPGRERQVAGDAGVGAAGAGRE